MGSARPEPQEERISSPSRLLPLLQRLKDTRTVLMVHFADDNVRYNSALLEIDTKTGTLTLDELVPHGGHEKLLALKRLHVTGRLAGATVRFRGELVGVAEQGGTFRYRFALPDQVTYQQRRSAFRARVPPALAVPVTLTLGNEDVCSGELSDLSSGGIGFMVEQSAARSATAGSAYICRIALPQGGTLALEMELRFVGTEAIGQRVSAGGRFLSVSGPLQNAIDRFVMYLQRETIRRSRETG